jgi:hypothetical protein
MNIPTNKKSNLLGTGFISGSSLVAKCLLFRRAAPEDRRQKMPPHFLPSGVQ